ncbi:MAG: ferrous iron transport protein A [Propionibacteriaceae bacterium]|jgi:Fe2+ transport system protein FeoA|nr:ferrous iron transport protein A [Propionibacteriaceae bacterium]
MPLILRDAPLRSTLVLSRGLGDCSTARRLAALGLREGAEFQLTQKTAGGGRMAQVGQSRVAIGAELSKQLLVEPVS